jgi:CubicO group peptidase (beta-lactamase class C family)
LRCWAPSAAASTTVRETFEENFGRRGELGGACCAYYRGEKVVDLWGGIRNKQTGEPWERDTMVLIYSATKGLAAMTLAIAHSRGWLDYEERVAKYWPEFPPIASKNSDNTRTSVARPVQDKRNRRGLLFDQRIEKEPLSV